MFYTRGGFKLMERCVNLLGDLQIYKTMGIKPNFSALSRMYGLDRHTIKKYHDNDGRKLKTREKRTSKYERYLEESKTLLAKPGVTITAAFEYLKAKYQLSHQDFNYNGYRHYIRQQEIKVDQKHSEVHLRYETKPGEQLQVDWKESIKMSDKHGHSYQFNILTATLGYSRLHSFIYSKTRTTEDFIRCLIQVFNKLGGTPKHILTDNMSAVVSITNGHKKKHMKIKQLEKDLNIKIQLCKVSSPETKGKVESANRFLSWLKAYDGLFEDEMALIETINQINYRINEKNNGTTQLPPIKLFEKEKEYLNPISARLLLDSYIENVTVQTVAKTLLVSYAGNNYSVPSKFIGKRVRIIPIDNKLYIYHNMELITIHERTNNLINYKKEDYMEGLMTKRLKKDNQEIEDMAMSNLELLERIKT